MAVHVGDRGQALTSLHPQGFVQVNGQRYDARSESGAIAPESEIVVVTGDHLGLVVRKIESGQLVPPLPKHGVEVYTSFGERVQQEHLREEAARKRWRYARRRYSLRMGAILGGLFSVGGLAYSWDRIVAAQDSPWLLALIVGLVGVLWGAIVFRFLDARMQRYSQDFHRLTFLSTCLALLGTILGATVGIPLLGLTGGIVLAVTLTLFVGLAVPAAVTILQ